MKIFELILSIVSAVVSMVGKVARSTKKAITRKDVETEVSELEKLKEDLKSSKYWKD